MAEQKFLDNLNGVPTLWARIKEYFALKSSVPTKVSDLTNDSGYKTTDTKYTLTKSGSEIILTGTDGTTNKVTDSTATSVTGGVTGVKGEAESSYRTGEVNITRENLGLGTISTHDSQVVDNLPTSPVDGTFYFVLGEEGGNEGDSSNTTVSFEKASTRTNIVTGESMTTIMGKIQKYLDDLKAAAFSGNISDLTNDSNYQTATQVDSKISTALTSAVIYQGTVATESALPTSPKKGHLYNITAVSSYGGAGTNVIWDGSKWDPQAGTFTVNTMTADDVNAICTIS